MQRICHSVTTKFPNLKFFGLCHEIYSMEVQLPKLLNTERSNIDFRAGGLNHLSILVEANFKDTGTDAYPVIHQKFEEFYSNYENIYDNYHHSKPGGERGVFFHLYQKFGYLPITVDSHLGEYLSWGHSVADHDGINEFYTNYKRKCMNFSEAESEYANFFNLNNRSHERIVPILEAILEDENSEEAAVNIPNNGCIKDMPDDIVVEVPAKINSSGIHGIKLNNYPRAFCSLLNSQVGCIRMTTEAVLNQSKSDAYFALLADPVVDNARSAEKLLDTIIELQNDYLGYLR